MTPDPPKKETPLKAVTGQSFGTLAWMAVGAAVGAAMLAPLVMRWLGVSFEVAMMIGGAAFALLFGALSKYGKLSSLTESGQKVSQGAVVFGVGLFGAKLLAPLMRKIPWIGGGFETPTNTDPALVGLA